MLKAPLMFNVPVVIGLGDEMAVAYYRRVRFAGQEVYHET